MFLVASMTPHTDSCCFLNTTFLPTGFYGDALALPKGDCQPCYCNAYGTVAEDYGPPVCDQVSGQCQCKAHVTGLKCDECEPGYWNLASGRVSGGGRSSGAVLRLMDERILCHTRHT